jgi:hypothetical protein
LRYAWVADLTVAFSGRLGIAAGRWVTRSSSTRAGVTNSIPAASPISTAPAVAGGAELSATAAAPT